MDEIVKGAWASAKCNGDFMCVETYSGYSNSRRDPKGEQYFLAPEASNEKLGLAVVNALGRSRFVLPAPRTDVWIHPDAGFDMELYDYKQTTENYATWVKDLMIRYGYKTKRALFKKMKSCSIERKGGVISIGPSHHEKLESWGRENDDGIEDVVIPESSTSGEIGAALRLAFGRCTG
jgi:hypothetical protein